MMLLPSRKQVVAVLALLAASAFGICPDVGAAEGPAFTVIFDPEYRRPIWQQTPPKDRNGEQPREVLKRFLDRMSSGDLTAAAKQCHYGWREGDGAPDRSSWHTIEGEEFTTICRSVRAAVTQVTLSESFVKGKSGYWSIAYKFKNKAGDEDDFHIHLLRVDDVWKIRETSVLGFTGRLEHLRKSSKAEVR